MKKFTFGLFILSSLFAFKSFGQGTIQDHFIYFKNKTGTPFTTTQPSAYLSSKAIARRTRQNIAVKPRDLPVTPAYVQALRNAGATVNYTSKWFNGAMVQCNATTLAAIQNLPFVKNTFTANRTKPTGQVKDETELPITNLRISANRSHYATSYNQAHMIGATAMHDAGFRGENMTIAVFDAGFPGVDVASPFAHLFLNNQLKGGYDFVDNDNTVYEKNSHGTNVLSTIGAYELGKFIGTAYKANFYLFITEDVASEHHIEEFNWLFAAEFADSVGVDVINSSLGYTTFDLPSVDYAYSDMNGQNAIVTRAADIAANTGMLVVNSAGNEGNSGWHYIRAPADADSILTVGAVDSLGVKASFSSFGPTFDGRIKPNVSVQGALAAIILPSGQVSRSNGTSFSSPIMCGMATAFWQAHPNLTNMQVIQFLQQSGNMAANPDNNIGYGVPNFVTADALASGVTGLEKDTDIFPNPLVSEDNEIKINLAKSYLGPFSVKVYDRTGRIMQETELSINNQNKITFKLNPVLANGLYFMQLSWGNKVKVQRLVKL